MSAHTPGPWVVYKAQRRSRPAIRSAEGFYIVEHVTDEANARLIAASPTLLDALRDLCDQAERSLDYRPEFREALARGLAAIHHATQEQK